MAQSDRIVRLSLPFLLLAAACDRPPEETGEGRFGAAATPPRVGTSSDAWDGDRWTNGHVAYVIDRHNGLFLHNACARNGTTTAGQVQGIHDGLAEYEALTPLRFHEYLCPPGSRVPGECDAGNPPGKFILYRSSTVANGAASIRGMPHGSQTINCVHISIPGPRGNLSLRNTLHETGHALGFSHEQQRSDRDTFVTYNNLCVTKRDQKDGKLFTIDQDGLLITPYDITSIMHYDSSELCDPRLDCHAAATATGACLHPPLLLKPHDTVIAHPSDLSIHDVNALYRMYEKALGTDHPDDGLGTAFAVGDFDHDGYDDLAVGAPGKGPHGAVYLWKGTAGDTEGTLGRLVAWKVLELPATAQHAERCGESLAAGDFDHNHHTDLAVGCPGDGGGRFAGEVVIYSSTTATAHTSLLTLSSTVFRIVDQRSLGLASIGEAGDHFGQALVAADFDGDGERDLAIGVPRKRVGGVSCGEVVVVLGNSPDHGLVLAPVDVPGADNHAGQHFGAALAAAKLNPDDADVTDLVVGGPATGTSRSGAVYLFLGRTRGGFAGTQVLHPDPLIAGGLFGAAIAVGDFDAALTSGGHSENQLAIGAPGTPRSLLSGPHGPGGTVTDVGQVYVFRNSSFRPSSVPFAYVQALKVEETHPTQGDRFGGSLITFPFPPCTALPCIPQGDILFAGLPARNRVDEYYWVVTLDAAGQTSLSLTSPTGLGARVQFGQVLAKGNFRPPANGPETIQRNNALGVGQLELVVGAPGFDHGAGELWVDNFDQTDLALSWQRFSQETAHPE